MKRLLVLAVFVAVTAAAPASDAPRRTEKRLVVIKADGLPPELIAAAAFPERPELMAKLSYGEDLKAEIDQFLEKMGRDYLMPNLRRHFFEDGVWVRNTYSHTVTLSAVSWGVIDTGQPSIVKGHGVYSRDTSYLRGHLDGFRDQLDALFRQPGYAEAKSTAAWTLDQAGVSLVQDAFDPLRTWTGPQIYRRVANWGMLAETGLQWLTAGGSGPAGILRHHLSRFVTGLDYTEFNQEMSASTAGRRILDSAPTGEERFDFVSPLFTLMDHQQHVDPHPINLVHWLSVLDDAVGQIFAAIGRSNRRDNTVVVLVSDHGSEIQPGLTGFSFPLTRIFREPYFGGHNVRTLLVENAWSAVSVPLPGIDRPRLYESRHSPYNPYGNPKHGEKGWTTAFIDPFGNGRASIFLRNNDLNRLHLLLLALQEEPDEPRFLRIRERFRETLERTRRWLEPDFALYSDYHAGARDLAANLAERADPRSRDTGRRLVEEAERDAVQLAALTRLLDIRFDSPDSGSDFDKLFNRPFQISDFIPKEFMGRPNDVYQLANYTIGVDKQLGWIEETVDHQGRTHAMNYPELLAGYRASNAPVNGLANPFDVMIVRLPDAAARDVLLRQRLVEPDERCRNVVWIKSSHPPEHEKGGEALLVQRQDGALKYVPLKSLTQNEAGVIDFARSDTIDPLGLLHHPALHLPAGFENRLEWLQRFHPWRQWLRVVHETEYSSAPIIFADIVDDAAAAFIDNPDFHDVLVNFSSPELKQRYLRGLRRKYNNQFPDLTVWSDELWNFNSKARTSGGNHSGLRPITTRLSFLLWGGDATGLARGRVVDEIVTSLDIVPTMFRAVDLLDRRNRVIKRSGAHPEHVFRPLAGKVVDGVFAAPEAKTGQSNGTRGWDR